MAHLAGVLIRGRPEHLGIGHAAHSSAVGVDGEGLGRLAGRHRQTSAAQHPQQSTAHPGLAHLGTGAAHQHHPLRTQPGSGLV